MGKKTVEDPQVQYIDKIVDMQFKEMNPWRYRGRLQYCGLSRNRGDTASLDIDRAVDVPVNK